MEARRANCLICLQANSKKRFGCCVGHLAHLLPEELDRRLKMRLCLICSGKLSIYNREAICHGHMASSGSPGLQALFESNQNYKPIGASMYK
jgi:hypothetical protein